MKNLFQRLKNNFTDNILNKTPYDLLANLTNIEYSVSAVWEPTEFESFEKQNPRDRVVLYGCFFEDLYWDYFARLTCKIQNWRLPSSGYFHNYPWEVSSTSLYKRDERPYISDGAYEKMPKRYRGVFKKYNSIAYVLNTHAAPYKIFIVKPENRPEMESLLLNMAEILDKKNGIRGNFVANDITKEQIDDIKTLHDICVKLNNITQPGFKHSFAHAGENHKQRHGATDVYNEYMKDYSRKNRYLKMQEQINKAKQKRDLQQQAAVSHYDTTRSIILADAKKQITR